MPIVIATPLIFSFRSYIIFITFIISSFNLRKQKAHEKKGGLCDSGLNGRALNRNSNTRIKHLKKFSRQVIA
jgi:hypothetical protein